MNIEQVKNVINDARRDAATGTAKAEKCMKQEDYEKAADHFRAALSAQKVALQYAADFLSQHPAVEQL